METTDNTGDGTGDDVVIGRTYDTLSHMLTGGPYVRSLFLANSQRFVRVGRSSAPDTEAVLPAWLQVISRRTSDDAWVGAPMPDPENPGERVVPVARRVGHGKLRDTWAR